MRRSEMAVIRRAVRRGQRASGRRRVILTADRGFAEGAGVDVLTEVGVEFIIRVKGSPNVAWQGQWRALHPVPVVGNAHQRTLGRDTKGELGFAPARIRQIHAWSRLFALFALALLVVVSLGMHLVVREGPGALALLRRVASRRRGR